MKDIFVDNCAAKNFANPLDKHYKEFITWLKVDGILVVSQKLLMEFGRTCDGCIAGSNIVALVHYLTINGRLVRFSSKQLKEVKFPKRITRKLLSNHQDHVHIKVVILSHRKLAITGDKNLRKDLNAFPGYVITAVKRPEAIDYK